MQGIGIKISMGIMAVLMGVLVIMNIVSLSADPVYASGPVDSATDTVTVYGQGRVAISPDQATITFGYENENADPAAAQEENKTQMERIVSAVKAQGLGDADLQTVSYQVYRDSSKNKFIVCNMMQVKIGDIEKTSGIIKAAYDAGANEFWDVRFDIVKRQEAYTDALHLAMERAREKAEMLAADEGRRVQSVVVIEEGTVDNSYYYASPYTNFIAGSASSSGGYADGGISSGELEISAVVNVTYRLG